MTDGIHLAKGSMPPSFPDDGLMRLFSMRFCPYAHRIHLVLSAKKLQFHTAFINLSEKPEWLTSFSPLGKVPALQIAATENMPVLIESLIIADYLDEKYPDSPLYPKDPLKKAQDRILIERFSSVTTPIYKMFLSTDSDVANAEMCDGLEIYEKELRERGTPFFGGDMPGMLDYMIWPWCERVDMLKHLIDGLPELDKERFSHLLKWRTLMIADPAVKSFYLDGETHAKFMRGRREGKADYNMLVV